MLGVLEIEHVGNHSQAVLVAALDDGVGDVGRHPLDGTIRIVGPEFQEVHALLRLLSHGGVHLARGSNDRRRYARHRQAAAESAFVDQAQPSGVHPGHRGPALSLLGSHVENQILVDPQTEHGGDAVGGVHLQVVFDRLAGIQVGILCKSNHVSDVTVQVDEARHDELAGQVHRRGPGGRLELGHRSDPANPPLFDRHRGVRCRWTARSVDQREAGEHDRVRRRCGALGGRTLAGRDRQQRQEKKSERCLCSRHGCLSVLERPGSRVYEVRACPTSGDRWHGASVDRGPHVH